MFLTLVWSFIENSMGSKANETMTTLVHSHIKSSLVRRQLLKLDSLYHTKISIWKHRKMYKLRKSDSCAQCFFLTHTFLLQKKKGGTVSDNLKQAFEQMCFIN